MKDRANRGREKRGFLSGLAPRVKRDRKQPAWRNRKVRASSAHTAATQRCEKKEPRPSRGSQGARLKS